MASRFLDSFDHYPVPSRRLNRSWRSVGPKSSGRKQPVVKYYRTEPDENGNVIIVGEEGNPVGFGPLWGWEAEVVPGVHPEPMTPEIRAKFDAVLMRLWQEQFKAQGKLN